MLNILLCHTSDSYSNSNTTIPPQKNLVKKSLLQIYQAEHTFRPGLFVSKLNFAYDWPHVYVLSQMICLLLTYY